MPGTQSYSQELNTFRQGGRRRTDTGTLIKNERHCWVMNGNGAGTTRAHVWREKDVCLLFKLEQQQAAKVTWS